MTKHFFTPQLIRQAIARKKWLSTLTVFFSFCASGYFMLDITPAFSAPIVLGSFSTTWDTGESDTILIDLGVCPSSVYWEEIGNNTNNGTSTSCVGSEQTIVFPSPGEYRVDFTGNFTQIYLGDQTNRDKFRSVEQWGDSAWEDFYLAFLDVNNLSIPAIDAPDLTNMGNIDDMFFNASNFNSDISHWDVSTITSMRQMFLGAQAFNQPLNAWDVSNVTNMESMFQGASSFNQPLNTWDVSSVTNMNFMFNGATSFNQDISNWTVSTVTQMNYMFGSTDEFNQPLNSWDVSSVTTMDGMFGSAYAFNQPLNLWDVSSVSSMGGMFNTATAFNQNLGAWDLMDGVNMEDIFFDSGLDRQNYSAMLISWSALPIVPQDTSLGNVRTTYCDTATAARTSLVTTHGWIIDDLGAADCSNVTSAPIVAGSFSTTWDTGDDDEISFDFGICPGAVYWEEIGDPTNNGTDVICGEVSDDRIIVANPGEYRIDFSGNFTRIDISLSNGQFRSVEQWGNSIWTDLSYAFSGVADLVFNAIDTPNLTNVTTMEGMFENATNFNSPLNSWDVSAVTDMGNQSEECEGGMFQNATAFNQPLNLWDVSNVTDMQCMFSGATAFNQPLASWNVANVTEMSRMFENSTTFNQPLESWDVSNVIRMNSMFSGATAFNQPLNNWNLASLTSFRGMFQNAIAFNQPLNLWNVSGVTSFSSLFEGASAFDQNLVDWAFDDGDVLTDVFADSGISSENYSATLDWWASLNLMPDLSFGREDMGSVPTSYCDTSETAYTLLFETNGWAVSDEGSDVCGDDEEEVVSSNGGGGGTKVGVRQKRLEALRQSTTSTSTMLNNQGTLFDSVNSLISYLNQNKAEVDALNPQEKSQLLAGLLSIVGFLQKIVPII